jgi:predicted ester cyclase
MTEEENKALARRVIEEMFNNGNLDVADELIASDYVDHDPAMPEDIHGPEGFKEYVGAYRSAFPDLHIQIEDQIAEEDKVTTRWTGTGTHEGELAGIAPTGRPGDAAGIVVNRLPGRELVEQEVPGAATPYRLGDGVEQLACLVSALTAAGLGFGDEGLEDPPFLVGEVGGVGYSGEYDTAAPSRLGSCILLPIATSQTPSRMASGVSRTPTCDTSSIFIAAETTSIAMGRLKARAIAK